MPGPSTGPVNLAKGGIECHMPSIWAEATRAFKADHNIRVP
jgi:hypothetical protein